MLYLEVEREVPSISVGSRVLWLIVLVYDIAISILMSIQQNETGSIFYLTIIHALKVMCNILIVIVENCLGVNEGRRLDQGIEERLLARQDEEEPDTEYLDIMSSIPPEQKFSSKGQEIRAKRNKNFLDIQTKAPDSRHNRANSTEYRLEKFVLATELESLAFLHPRSGEGLDFVVDGKVESIRSEAGDKIDHFMIEVYLGAKLLTKVKRNLIQIRCFDNEVRYSINYDMPNLSDLSK